MRRKKNLETRIADCGKYFIDLRQDSERDTRLNNKKDYLNFEKIFNNKNDVFLEIGCGKGGFANSLALRDKDKNILALEKSDNVLVSAAETAVKNKAENLRFLFSGAEYIERFIPPKSISGIYLNFSCPYPKKRYINHRLTAKRFLDIYKNILKPDAVIYQKTDNMKLFEFSIEQFSSNDFAIKNISLDLHHSGKEDNIVTEYEAKFVSMGMPIYYLEAYLK